MAFTFGPYKVDAMARTLTNGSEEIHLANRPFDILITLIENRDRVVRRSELLDKFWDGHEVYDDALRKCVASIRKALKDNRKPPLFVETRYGDGFRFIADVSCTNGNGNRFQEPNESLPESPESSASTRRRNALIAGIPTILIAIVLYSGIARNWDSSTSAASASAIPAISSIMVMPVRNVSDDGSDDYFSDGMTESILTQLTRSPNLRIIPGGSLLAKNATGRDPLTVGRELNADAILEGSFQRRGEKVIVRMRLVSVRDGTIFWTSNEFERSITDAYDLQEVIACDIAAELRSEICGENPKTTRSGRAYQEYVKGRYEWNKRTAEGIKRSIEHYQLAIQFDPGYSLAYAGLSESYLQGIWHVPFNSAEALPKALETALTAVKLDDGLAEAHSALASAYSLQWKWDESEREFQRAVVLNPRYARAYHTQAFAFMIKGRFEESLASIDRAAELDPLNLVISTDKANLLLAAGRTDEAFKQWERTFSIDPNFVMAREHRLVAYEFVGNDAAAIDEKAAIMQSRGESKEKIAQMRSIGNSAGFAGIRKREYSELLSKIKRGDHVSPVAMANYCSLLGNRDEAFAWLEKAFRERSAEIVLIVSPEFSGIHNDPRYNELLSRIGLR